MRRAAQGQLGGGDLRVRGSLGAQTLAASEELAERLPAQLFPQVFRCGYDQGLEDVDCRNAGELGTIAGDDEGSESFTGSA
jgi:hypothetical protein